MVMIEGLGEPSAAREADGERSDDGFCGSTHGKSAPPKGDRIETVRGPPRVGLPARLLITYEPFAPRVRVAPAAMIVGRRCGPSLRGTPRSSAPVLRLGSQMTRRETIQSHPRQCRT